LNKEEGYKRGSFPPLIRKEEEVGNPINEKWVDSPTLDPNQTETVLKYKQNVRNETNKWPGPFKGLHKAVSKDGSNSKNAVKVRKNDRRQEKTQHNSNTEVFYKGKQYSKQHKNTIDKATTENRLRKMERKPPALECEGHVPPLDGRSPAGKAGFAHQNPQKQLQRKFRREDVLGTCQW